MQTSGLALVGGLERFDIEFHHLQHGRAHACRFRPVLVLHQLTGRFRHDLPRQAVFILEPAALLRFTARKQRIPVAIDFCLIIAS